MFIDTARRSGFSVAEVKRSLFLSPSSKESHQDDALSHFTTPASATIPTPVIRDHNVQIWTYVWPPNNTTDHGKYHRRGMMMSGINTELPRDDCLEMQDDEENEQHGYDQRIGQKGPYQRPDLPPAVP